MNAAELVGGNLATVVALCFFLVIFLVTLRALESASVTFVSRFILAGCVSLLSVIGLVDLLREPDRGIHFLLIPYSAMAISLVGAGLLAVIMTLLRVLGFGKAIDRCRRTKRGDGDRPSRHALECSSSAPGDTGSVGQAGAHSITGDNETPRRSRPEAPVSISEIDPRPPKLPKPQRAPLADAGNGQRGTRKQ